MATDDQSVGLHVSRRNLLRAGAAVGIGAWAAPVISAITASPASAWDGEKASGGTTTHKSCHPLWPGIFVFFTDYFGHCYGAYCESGSKSFKGLDDRSWKYLVYQHNFWNGNKWGPCPTKESDDGYGGDSGGYFRPAGSTYDKSWSYYRSYVQDFKGAGSTFCSKLSGSFEFDKDCGQPICWTPPRGCNPPPHCSHVKFYCQDSPGGSLREVSCDWDGKYKFV